MTTPFGIATLVGNSSSDTATIGAHDGNHTVSGNQAFGGTGCLCGIDTATYFFTRIVKVHPP
jgi:hypothetical protein